GGPVGNVPARACLGWAKGGLAFTSPEAAADSGTHATALRFMKEYGFGAQRRRAHDPTAQPRRRRTRSSKTATGRAPGRGPALFQLELDEFDERGTGVPPRPRLPAILPDEIAFVRRHAAIRRSGHHFGQYAAVDVDPEPRCRLRDLSGRLARFQND